MPIDRDLFLSILALDSYNRGYNEGVVISGSSGLGTATFLQDTNTAPAQQAGFYGIAYNWEGEKIISYRGTDNFGLANDIGGAGASDITTGWTLALGYPGGGQAALAMQFYQTVTGVSSPYFPAPGELTLARVARNKNADCRVHKTRPLHALFCFARRQQASASCTMIDYRCLLQVGA